MHQKNSDMIKCSSVPSLFKSGVQRALEKWVNIPCARINQSHWDNICLTTKQTFGDREFKMLAEMQINNRHVLHEIYRPVESSEVVWTPEITDWLSA